MKKISQSAKLVVLAIACLTISVICTGTSLAAEHKSAETIKQRVLLGKRRPDFALPDINNKKHDLNKWQGQILFVNFWATWCTPCRKEIPVFNRLQKEYQDQGVQFIGIAIDNSKAVKKFIKTIPIDYPNLIGGAAAVRLAVFFGNIRGTLPYTALVDRDGNIQAMISGKLTEESSREAIEKLL